jgi:soluble cytochrome b562
MSISAISSPATNPVQSWSGQANSFSQLASALNSGNLSAAQQAYATLSQQLSSSQGWSTNGNNPFATALNQIGQDLQNGDLGGAQQALASLQQARGSHHHGRHGQSSSASADSQNAVTSASQSDVASSSSNILNITA